MMEPMHSTFSRREMMAAGLASLEGMIDGKIVALCDLESARMESVNKGLPEKAETYTDYRELIRDKQECRRG